MLRQVWRTKGRGHLSFHLAYMSLLVGISASTYDFRFDKIFT